MPTRRSSRTASILGGVVGCLYVVVGFLEVATHLDEPAGLVFWISSLWGGGALVLYGSFGRPEVATRLVVAGSLIGFLATLWTLIIPVLATALVFVTIRNSGRDTAAS